MSVLLGLDQFVGVLLGPVIFYRIQSPDETISSHLGRLKRAHGGYIPWRYPLARLMDCVLEIIQPGHSIGAIEPPDRDGDL